jgi:hypothetical protein
MYKNEDCYVAKKQETSSKEEKKEEDEKISFSTTDGFLF